MTTAACAKKIACSILYRPGIDQENIRELYSNPEFVMFFESQVSTADSDTANTHLETWTQTGKDWLEDKAKEITGLA